MTGVDIQASILIYLSKDDLISDIANIHLAAITNAVIHCVQGIESIGNSKEQMINLIMD